MRLAEEKTTAPRQPIPQKRSQTGRGLTLKERTVADMILQKSVASKKPLHCRRRPEAGTDPGGGSIPPRQKRPHGKELHDPFRLMGSPGIAQRGKPLVGEPQKKRLIAQITAGRQLLQDLDSLFVTTPQKPVDQTAPCLVPLESQSLNEGIDEAPGRHERHFDDSHKTENQGIACRGRKFADSPPRQARDEEEPESPPPQSPKEKRFGKAPLPTFQVRSDGLKGLSPGGGATEIAPGQKSRLDATHQRTISAFRA
jgi:hypothetical protein